MAYGESILNSCLPTPLNIDIFRGIATICPTAGHERQRIRNGVSAKRFIGITETATVVAPTAI